MIIHATVSDNAEGTKNYTLMKKILLIIFSLLQLMAYSQIDSTEIVYRTIDNADLRTICDLAQIQVIKVECTDKQLRGKVFNLIIKEITKGKVTSEDNFYIDSKERQIPMVVGKDTVNYVISMIDKAGFADGIDTFSITFAGIFKDGVFKLKIRYPGLGYERELKGKIDYILKEAAVCSDNRIKIPINHPFPILAYTPPMETESDISSYCLLGGDNIEDWNSKFKIKHFYVFYLEIK
jgi:hypothetical protein